MRSTCNDLFAAYRCGGAVQRGSGYGGGGHSYRVARRDKAQDQLANAAIKAVEEKVPVRA
jgi:hypothetical protein